MPAIFELNQFGTLPLWGQALIAARMVRRGVLAALPDATPEFRDRALAACATIERASAEGELNDADERALKDAMNLRDRADSRVASVASALWWAIDSCRAARGAQDFPVDASVSNSALRAVGELGEDARVSRAQLTVLLAADFDLVRFACSEISVGRYDALTAHVLERLAPVHPLTLVETPMRGTHHAEREAR
ncbi:MAG: hypothetical protein HUU19_08200 [Phycisphaerales bacterium]|jgi:hypothetical protein|nr:hypothetical protein [Phycisphaerales bacterium]